jgi:hypothetical protein
MGIRDKPIAAVRVLVSRQFSPPGSISWFASALKAVELKARGSENPFFTCNLGAPTI